MNNVLGSVCHACSSKVIAVSMEIDHGCVLLKVVGFEILWRNLPELILRELRLQLLLEDLNPVSTVTVSLRQTKHPPSSFPARPY